MGTEIQNLSPCASPKGRGCQTAPFVFLGVSSQRSPDVFEQEHQLEWVHRRWLEIEMLVELTSSVIDRMNQNGPDSHDTGSFFNALQRVEQQRLPKSLALLSPVDRQPSKKHDSNRMVRETLRDSLGALVLMYGAGRERIIAETRSPVSATYVLAESAC